MVYHLITTNEKEEWTKYVTNSLIYDFYHTWYYHSLDKSGKPCLFVYEEGDIYIALPFLQRPINESISFDLTSVYGYAGPISNIDFGEMTEGLKENFKKAFNKFLLMEQNICVFSRLHPFINQQVLLKEIGGIYANGKTVAIDLTIPLEAQRAKYRKSTFEGIKRLRRKGYYVKEAESVDDIKTFVEIYAENMKRIGALDYYLFDEQYFINLLKAEEFRSKLVLVYLGDKAICGSVYTSTNSIVEGHLIATLTDHIKESPAKLLIDEISLIGRKSNMKYFHLGGGVGGSEDSLFNWKAGFSDLFLDFKTWRYVANEDAYNLLVEQRVTELEPAADFFPLYRKMA